MNSLKISADGLENAYRELEQKYLKLKDDHGRIFENVVEGVYRSSPDGKFVAVNPAFTKMLGYADSAELIGRVENIEEQLYVNPKLRAHFRGLLEQHGEARNLEFEARRRDGNPIWLSVSVRVIKGETGEPLCYEGFVQDITFRKKFEAELRESEERFYRLSEAAFEGLLLVSEGQVLEVNDAFLKMTGYQRSQVVGRPITQFIHSSRLTGERNDEFYEVTIQGADKLCSGIELRNKPLPYQGKEVEAVALRDVSARQRAEEKITAVAQELARSNSELENFAYIASHDLREPLRMVKSFLELFVREYKDGLEPRGKEFIDFALDGATRMNQMIEDLLTFCRAGRKQAGQNISDGNLVFEEVLNNLKLSIIENSASVDYDVLPMVSMAPVHLARLFQNLLSNAIKFRGPAAPQIRLSVRSEPRFWVFSIEDNGIGIADDDHERIFLLFQRSHTRKYAGSGMGLSICKRIIESHCGKIWVENSELGKGAKFSFSVPKAEESILGLERVS